MKYEFEHVRSLHVGYARSREIIACMEALHPALQTILDAELRAGNFVRDASRNWPDEGSIFITLTHPFHQKYEVGDPVVYHEPGDPHYWTADYSCGTPTHVLAH